MKIENIKFKAKRLDNGEWVEGSLTYSQGTAFIHCKESDEDDRCYLTPYEVNPHTVCQFTGLKDSEGNEIWEGDMIRSPYLGNVATVEWDDSLCGFKCVNDRRHFNYSFRDIIKRFGWSLIGNKFDKKK